MFLNQKRIIDLTELCDLKKLITVPIIRVGWRSDSHTGENGDGHPLDGGYYDAGDNLKFNWPMAYTTVLLAWSGIAFPDGYAKAGQRGYLEGVVRWATDYFIKCHVSDHEFYAQVSADMLTLLSVAVL